MAATTTPSVGALLAELGRLPLLSADRQAEAAAVAPALTPHKLVGLLLERGWVTRFQADMLLAGTARKLVFGPYLLLDKVGGGGMGVVFRARQTRLDRVVALKVLRNDRLASTLVARRFRREIRLTASLEHPHIVRALDAGAVGQQMFLATEFVRGSDLAVTVRERGPLSPADACLAVFHAALALQHILDRGLVHRDLKPSNLIREDATGSVKLLDLGLSAVYDSDPSASLSGALTRDGVLLGTPDYMAPEQAQDPRTVDIRADLYSLGCTFFFLLTGRPPFAGSQVDKLFKHGFEPPPPVTLPCGDAPPALGAIVHRLMAKKPADRFQTPRELIDALLALRPGQPPPTVVAASAGPTPTAPDSSADWQSEFGQMMTPEKVNAASRLMTALPSQPRKLPGWLPWAGPAAGAVALAVLLVVAWPRVRTAEPEPVAVAPQLSPDEQASEDLRALRRAADAPGEDRESVRKRVLDFRGRLPGSTIAATAAGLLRRLPSPLDRVEYDTDPETDARWRLVSPPAGSVEGVQFSAGGDRLWVTRPGRPAEEWSLSPGPEAVAGTPRPVQPATVPTVSPDGRRLLAMEPGGGLYIRDAVTSRERSVRLGSDLPVRAAVEVPGGKHAVVAYRSPEEQPALVDLANGRVAARLDVKTPVVLVPRTSADGKWALLTGADGAGRVFELPSGKLARSVPPETPARGRVDGAFGPDGQRLYLIGTGPGVQRVGLVGKPSETTITSDDRRGTCVAVSADESQVVVGTSNGEVRVMATNGGRLLHTLKVSGRPRAVAFSPCGRAVAVATDDGSVRLMPLK